MSISPEILPLLITLGLILTILAVLAVLTLVAAAAIVFIAGSGSDPNEVEIDPNAKIAERYRNNNKK